MDSGKMWDKVVRAGKYTSAGLLLFASLPLLISLLLVLSFLGLVFVVPVGCALAGFLYLRKAAVSLHRSPVIAAGSWGILQDAGASDVNKAWEEIRSTEITFYDSSHPDHSAELDEYYASPRAAAANGSEQNAESGSPIVVLSSLSIPSKVPSDNDEILEPRTPEAYGGSNLMPNQANEDDIWVCKECGWKYPNARPSAKIRRNHRRSCKGHTSTLSTPGDRLWRGRDSELADIDSPDGTGSKDNVGISSTSSRVDDCSREKIEDGYRIDDERSIAIQGDVSAGTLTAEESVRDESIAATNKKDSTKEQGSSSLEVPPEPSPTAASSDELIKVIDRDVPSVEKERSSDNLKPDFWSEEKPTLSKPIQKPTLSKPIQLEQNVLQDKPRSKSVAFDEAAPYRATSGIENDADISLSPRSASASESFRSAPDEFTKEPSMESSPWASVSEKSTFDDQHGRLTQDQEVKLQEDLNAVKGIVGDQNASRGALLTDIQKLSDILGIDLPALSANLSELEWAKLAIEMMKVVVGVE